MREGGHGSPGTTDVKVAVWHPLPPLTAEFNGEFWGLVDGLLCYRRTNELLRSIDSLLKYVNLREQVDY